MRDPLTAAGEVLLVEDHRDIAAMICDFLESQSFSVDYAADGHTALRLAGQQIYDAVILDLMLPDIDGLEVCRRLRSARVEAPLLMLTARDTLADKLAGFDSGADDYLVKPFDLEELEARLHALIRRRRAGTAHEVIVLGDLALDLGRLRVTRGGQELTLTPIGFKILTVLMQAAPRVVTRHVLERAIWGDLPPDSDALRSHVYMLRKVVDRPFGQALIQTVPNTGFRIAYDN